MLVANGQDANAIAARILALTGDTETHHMGRARLHSVPLANGSEGLVRSYQHGGLFRRWSRDSFFTWPPRPFLELMATEEVRRRGVGTLEVVAALVAYGLGPFYRGWLITRELKRVEDLWSFFQTRELSAPASNLMGQVGRAVRSMHGAGRVSRRSQHA